MTPQALHTIGNSLWARGYSLKQLEIFHEVGLNSSSTTKGQRYAKRLQKLILTTFLTFLTAQNLNGIVPFNSLSMTRISSRKL